MTPDAAEPVLAHPFDLYHDNTDCATCRRDRDALRALDADMSRGSSVRELAQMMFLAMRVDGVLVHATDVDVEPEHTNRGLSER